MKESLIQTAIEHYLLLLENQGKLVYLKNNSGAFKNAQGNFYKMGRPGSSDFVVFLKEGKCLHLEVKNETGKQNQNQITFQNKVEALEHTYLIARSVDEVQNYLKQYNFA